MRIRAHTRALLQALARLVLGLHVGVAVVLLAMLGTHHGPTSIITGDSMRPALRPGDVVLTTVLPVQPPAADSTAPFAVGQLLLVRQGPELITHRLVGVVQEQHQTWLQTRGDAAPAPDRTVRTRADVQGIVTAVVPAAGLPRLWFARHQWLPLAAWVAALIAAAYWATPPGRTPSDGDPAAPRSLPQHVRSGGWA